MVAKKKTPMPTLPAVADVEKKLAPYMGELAPIVIACDEDYTQAGEALRHLKTEQKAVKGMLDDAMGPVNELSRTVRGWFTPALERLAGRESAIKQAIINYDRFKESERRRIEAELRDQHNRELTEAMAKADALAEAGDMEAAEQVLDELPSLPTVITAKPKLAGISTRETWHAEVVDFTEFMLWCIDNNRLDLLQVNDQVLQQHARNTKGNVPIAGVIIKMETGLAARSA